mmetsp:Transcript_32270/g.70304  ORF Transcript_32270/g.70304 Transcript_32270/m.70304 type:complete len:107 (-) Transcript_32270:787-1107(-)
MVSEALGRRPRGTPPVGRRRPGARSTPKKIQEGAIAARSAWRGLAGSNALATPNGGLSLCAHPAAARLNGVARLPPSRRLGCSTARPCPARAQPANCAPMSLPMMC